MPAPVDLIRWAARLLSIGAVLFVLTFAIGEDARQGTFNARSGTMLLFLVVGLGANLVAWRWEVGGAAAALIALTGLAAVQLTADGRPPGIWFFILLGIPALLHIASALLRTRPAV